MVTPGEMTAVSLFDGIGGFPLALSAAGVRTVATVEIDPAAAGVTAVRFPHARQLADVTEVIPDDLFAAGFVPARGILTAGWPCQDLSLAGRRLGLGGTRSGLFWEVVRLAAGLRPRWIFLENVPGLLSAVCSCPGLGACGGECGGPHPVRGGACGPGRCMELHGGAMGAVLGALGELGYGFAYRVLDAAHFGVPQRRRRVVIAGRLGDWAAPAAVLLEPESGGRHPAAGAAAGTDTARGPDGGPASTGGQGPGGALTTSSIGGVDENSAQAGHLVVSTLTVPSGGYRISAEYAAGNHLIPAVTAKWARGTGSPAGEETQNLITHAPTSAGADTSEDGTGRGTPLVLAAFDWQSDGERTCGDVSRARTGAPGTTNRDAVPEPVGVRRLTPVECERLQGFPDGWTATSSGRPQADSARYRQLGNSIAVPVFAWVARRIIAYERGDLL